MRTFTLLIVITMIFASSSFAEKRPMSKVATKEFKWQTEQFADAKILRYQVPGFDSLTLNQKKLIYFLSQAALSGRDITFDQNCKYNLAVRKTLEAIFNDYSGDRKTVDFGKFVVYLKRVWFCNGIHHHYSTDKFLPECSKDYFISLLKETRVEDLPLKKGQKLQDFIAEITSVIFDPNIAPKRVSLNPDADLVTSSATNFYEGVTQKEAEQYYINVRKDAVKNHGDTLIAFGLNSKLMKENGKIVEKTWKSGGIYSPAIQKIIYWLQKAVTVCETPEQKSGIEKLIEYYQTGSLKIWDDYNILWVKDLHSLVDYVNGFIEVYGDPLAKKGTWESMVNFKNLEATKRTELLSKNAQYFENNSPVDPKFKKKEVKGVTAKVITVVQLGGDCDPTTPIGINLPNAQWIRKEYGSKSVTMDNITYAYDKVSQGNGFLEEFAYSKEEVEKVRTFSYLAGNLTTDLHECLGHGSGQMNQGVSGESLKNYHSTIEEARADLFALYYIADEKMVNLGLVPSANVSKAEYDSFIRNGLMTQLVRVQPGKDIEEAHMRDRSLIAHWVFEKGKDKNVIEKVSKDGKTYFRINDYDALRKLFGQLLGEIQRITSEGDYNAAKDLVQNYAVKVDPDLHKEVLSRYKKLNIAPYSGFINPEFKLEMKNNEVVNIKIVYPDDFTKQMLDYSKKFSFIPVH
ncbi:MAG: dihydrofolate reductase [Bacteroidetes bacterium]|nr:dihydrofolate reductase [Bacteroidota bacterium]